MCLAFSQHLLKSFRYNITYEREMIILTQNEALLIIDYTNDFVAPDGTLTSGKPG